MAEQLSPEALLALPFQELLRLADNTRSAAMGAQLDLCTIINAKSGLCSEDCKFCAQSARHQTEVPTYPLKSKTEILAAASQAKENGAARFGLVTSGNKLTGEELAALTQVIPEIVQNFSLTVCASLGALTAGQLQALKEAGLTRYHHNIETSPNFYPQIVSSHNFQERLDTVKAAKSVGLEVCSGGIIGLGETWRDRIEMILTLRELDVDSVPLNLLVPIKGTPLGDSLPISTADAVKTIALFRIMLPQKTIKIAAGRETILKDFQALAFMAGANGMLIGGYLTIKGRSVAEDQALVREIKNLWNG